MTSILLVVLLLPYLALHMQIGQVVLVIENLWVVILCSLIERRFHEIKSSKQHKVACFFTEAEYKALADGTADVI